MKKIDLGFGTFELHEDFVIGKMNEGIHFNLELNSILGYHLKNHYGEKRKLGYISIRENSYSIDPMVHVYNVKYNNLCSIGIVGKSDLTLGTAKLERKFFKPKKLKSFIDKEDALVWTNHQILESYYKVN